jgi:hypothetical protein
MNEVAYSRARDLAALFPTDPPLILKTAPVNFAGDLVDEAARALLNAAYLKTLSEREAGTASPSRLAMILAAQMGEARLGHACIQLAEEKSRRA